MKNLILCGFMGSGKTTVGRLLAKRLQMEFIDLDEFTEVRAGLKIPEIFARFSESGFRDMEHEALSALLAPGGAGTVVATGGGALTFDRNVELAKKNGVIIFLNAGFETCYDRIKTGDRPLVKANTKAELEGLYQKRKSSYIAACATGMEIAADAAGAEELCAMIEGRLAGIREQG